MLGHYVCSYTNVFVWFYFVIPPKNVKNVINRFYRSELRNRCGFILYCLTPGGLLGPIFAGYVPLASQNPRPIIVIFYGQL